MFRPDFDKRLLQAIAVYQQLNGYASVSAEVVTEHGVVIPMVSMDATEDDEVYVEGLDGRVHIFPSSHAARIVIGPPIPAAPGEKPPVGFSVTVKPPQASDDSQPAP
jgi:hypothetical protein